MGSCGSIVFLLLGLAQTQSQNRALQLNHGTRNGHLPSPLLHMSAPNSTRWDERSAHRYRTDFRWLQSPSTVLHRVLRMFVAPSENGQIFHEALTRYRVGARLNRRLTKGNDQNKGAHAGEECDKMHGETSILL